MHMPKNYTSSQLPPGRFQHGAPWRGRYLFVGLLLLTTLFLLPSQLSAQRMWINEFHYDNVGGDVGEFIEVVVEDGADINLISIVLYDGADRQIYNSSPNHALTTFTQGDDENCFTIYSKGISGIQNGAPDGIALVYQGVMVEFISYEGTFVAADGPAAGALSVDIGVAESNGATPVQSSISRIGTGTNSGDFTWQEHVQETPGSLNDGQDLSDPNIAAQLTDTPENGEPAAPGDKIKYTTVISNTGDGAAKGVSLDRMAPTDPNTTLVPGSLKSTPIAYDAYIPHVVEDISYIIDLLGFDLDGNDGNDLTFMIITPPSNGTLDPIVQNGSSAAQVEYVPNDDYFGPDQFTFKVTDADGNECPATIFIMVQPVNDPPTITCGPNQSRPNSAGPANEPNWATGISVGPTSPPAPNGDESAFQTATITTANDNNGLFSVQPAVDAAGTLTYTPQAGATGVANVTVTISDGVFADDVSCSFTITIQSFPDAMDDDFVITSVTDLNGNLFNDNGNGADDLGFPAGTITGFGGGSLAGGPGTNAPGATVALAGGTLQVNANGTFSLTGQPFTPGTYTFLYTLDNGLNTDVATVTIVINEAPLAQNDAFTVVIGNNLSGDVNDDNGSGADNLGTPAATVSHFGGGSLGGAVTDNVAGAVVALAGGTFSIMANGAISLNGATTPGVYVVVYRLTNAGGTSDATVTITVLKLPDAMADDFSTQEDTDLNGDLFANNGNGADDLGSPAATITHFGGGSLGGSVTDNVAGSTVAMAGGTLQVNANGSFSLTGQPFTQGTFTFMYRLASAAGSDDATVTIEITPAEDPAVCNADSYNGTGNIAISINAASGVLSNDGGTNLVIEQIQGAAAVFGTPIAATNGSVTMAADGSFTFEPTAGAASGSFTYTIDNSLNQPSQCTVTITFSQMIWFVDVNGSGNNSGTFLNPFQTIAAFNAAAGPAAGHFISLNTGSYTEADGFNLKNNQTLLGKGVQLDVHFTAHANSVAAYHTFAGSAGIRPTIGTTGGAGNHGVDLASGNTLRGFNIGNRSGAFAIKDNGANAGTVTISNMIIQGIGGGIEIDNGGTLAIDLDQLSATATAGANIGLSGIDLANVSGSFVVDAGTLSHSTVPAIVINGSPLALGVTLTSVSSNGGANGINIQNTTGFFSVRGSGGMTMTNGSGGTIQNHTDDGIFMNNVTNLRLWNMDVTNNGNAVNEHGMDLNEVTGYIDFLNIDVSFSAEKNVEIANTSGALTFEADSSEFRDTQSSGTGADGLEIGIRGTATATINIDSCQFRRDRTNGIQVLVENTAQVTECDITNNIIDSQAGIGIGMDLSTNNSASLVYNVIGNSRIRSRNGSAINSTAFGTSSIQARIQNNPDIQVQSSGGNGVSLNVENAASIVADVSNNTVTLGTGTFDTGIACNAGNASGGGNRIDATINNNNITVPASALYDIWLLTTHASSTLCGNVTNNTASGNAIVAFRTRENPGNILMQSFSANATTTWNNNGNTPMGSVSESPAASVAGGTCTTVSHAMP